MSNAKLGPNYDDKWASLQRKVEEEMERDKEKSKISVPPVGTPITVYKMMGKTPKLLTVLPNKEPGKAQAYLRRLSERYIIGPCNRGVIQIKSKEETDA